MNERLQRVLDYEKRLIQDREQLMELLGQTDTKDSQLIHYKLECFQKEISFMNHQVELLKQEARGMQAVQPAQRAERFSQVMAAQTLQMPQPNVGQQVLPVQQTDQEQKRFTEQQEARTQRTEKATQTTQKAESVYVKRDLEKTVGKSLMGIFASVLIFISLILFATLLLPYFNDTAKMVTTYLVSLAFLGIGLVKLKKDKTNKFYIALVGCGIGALYISLLLSNMYFKALGDIPLYILITVWGIGVCLFAKWQSFIFQIIGELGITIAVMFGCVLCMNNEDAVKMLVLIIFYVISAGVFYMVHYKKEFVENLVHQISNVINVYALAGSTLYIVGDGMGHFESWLVLAIIVISLGSTLWHSLEKECVVFGVFAVIYAFMGYYTLDSILVNDEVFGTVFYIATIPLLALYELKKAEKKEGKYIVQAFLLGMATTALGYCDDWYGYGAVFLLILPALLVGYLRKNVVFKYASLVMLFLYTFEHHPISDIPHFILGCVAFVGAFGLLWWKKEQYSKVFKYWLHAMALFYLFYWVSDIIYELLPTYEQVGDMASVCRYMIFTIFNAGMMKSYFGRNMLTNEKENQALYSIANMLAMLVGVFMIGNGDYEGIWHILLILTVLGAFMINAKNLLDKRENILAGIYVGIKLTVLMVVILESFDTVNYIVSICCLLLAIAGIVLGFVGEYKSLRVFGLILSMISIFKLIMIDINYENTLGNAISFFVSGILCFVISLIYNYIENKVKERA